MPLKHLHAESRSGLLHLPEPNHTLEVATGKQVPIRAPGQREDRTGMRQVLQVCAQLRVPQPDGRVMSPTGEHASIRGKSWTGGSLGLPVRPEQGATLDVPQLDAAISKASAGQHAFVRAEGEGHYKVR